MLTNQLTIDKVHCSFDCLEVVCGSLAGQSSLRWLVPALGASSPAKGERMLCVCVSVCVCMGGSNNLISRPKLGCCCFSARGQSDESQRWTGLKVCFLRKARLIQYQMYFSGKTS